MVRCSSLGYAIGVQNNPSSSANTEITGIIDVEGVYNKRD
jgi:hypothetical protein